MHDCVCTSIVDCNMSVWTSMLTCMVVFMDSTEAYTCHTGAITVYNGIEGMTLQIFHPCHTGAITSFSPNLTVNLTADSRNGTEGIGVKFQWQ